MLKKIVHNLMAKNKLKNRRFNNLLNKLLNDKILHLKHKSLILSVMDNRIHLTMCIDKSELNELLNNESVFLNNTELTVGEKE